MKMIRFFNLRGTRKGRKNSEKGQVLAIVLILLLTVSVIIVSTLTVVGTTIKTNITYINSTKSLYAAEAGAQDGTWNILNKSSSDLTSGLLNSSSSLSSPKIAYSDYDYNPDGWLYQLPDINTYPVDIRVKNAWVPLVNDNDTSWIPSVIQPLPTGGITPPPPTKAKNIISNIDPNTGLPRVDPNTGLPVNLLVTGGLESYLTYKINIVYNGSTPASLSIFSIGCWLPQGFNYNNGLSNLQGIYATEQVLPCAGNEAVVWTFPPGTTYASLLSRLGGTIKITVPYIATNQFDIPDALAWVVNGPVTDFPYSYTWNADVKVHDIKSDAGNKEVETYVPKAETRALGSAWSGDYVAAGASLMVMGTNNGVIQTTSNDPDGTRFTSLTHSSSTVNTIPTDSGTNVVGAYLYWSGWFDNTNKVLGASYGTLVNFKINGYQVDFDSNGNAERGSGAVAADPVKNQTRVNTPTGRGYSYSCYKDVTALVQYELKTETNNDLNPGNAIYDVGPAAGCILATPAPQGTPQFSMYQWAYAGWSLIIIYSGPSTLGHQIYLYDAFSYADNGQDIDPTRNTNGPGGVISGFIVPPQVSGDVNVAKLTCFVGDGDWCFSGDFIAINAPSQYLSAPLTIPNAYKLWDHIDLPAPTYFIPYGDPGLPNNANSPNNVWNSYSQTGGAADGIDIKTFYIPWSSHLLNPGDTSVRVDMPTTVDSWNLIYIIFSFRSSATGGDSLSYIIRNRP